MKAIAIRAASVLVTLGLAVASGACAGDATQGASGEDVAQTGGQRVSFEAWAKANVRQEGEVYYVDGDFGLTREQAIAYYESSVSQSGALWSYSGSYAGLAKFPVDHQQNITWCTSSPDFTIDDVNRVETFAEQAMGAWEAVADVRYVHLPPGSDATCATSNADVRIVVMPESVAGAAAAGDAPQSGRHLSIKKSVIEGDSGFLLAVMQHELGHTLGFGHEHDRPTDATPCSSMNGCGAYDSPRDGSSVMYYVGVTGYTGGAGGAGWNYVSQWDLEGAQKVYGAPTDVVNTQDGTVYARKVSTGDLYRHESTGAWSKVGGPGQAFVSLGNTLYGQTPGGGYLVRHVSGQTWASGLSGNNGQLLRCANALCATNPTTKQIARYDGSSWTYIGGAGLRFAATETQLFGLRPQQDGVAVWSGAGSNWYYAGSTAETARELAGGGTSMYRIPTKAYATVERFDGSSWVNIGSFTELRQLHASGADVYALNRAYAVYRYNGATWNEIDAAPTVAVDRLYGSYGKLYGQGTDGTVYAYAAGSWTSLGKP